MNKIIALKAIVKINGSPAKIGKQVYDNGGYLEIYEWDSIDGDYWGYVRDDACGITVVTCFESAEDEETVAAWNVDFNTEKYLKRIPHETMLSLLEIAHKKGWTNRDLS